MPPSAPSGKQLPQIIKLIQTPPKPAGAPPKPVIKLITFGKAQSGGHGHGGSGGGGSFHGSGGQSFGGAQASAGSGGGQAFKLVPVGSGGSSGGSGGFSGASAGSFSGGFASGPPATSYGVPTGSGE